MMVVQTKQFLISVDSRTTVPPTPSLPHVTLENPEELYELIHNYSLMLAVKFKVATREAWTLLSSTASESRS